MKTDNNDIYSNKNSINSSNSASDSTDRLIIRNDALKTITVKSSDNNNSSRNSNINDCNINNNNNSGENSTLKTNKYSKGT